MRIIEQLKASGLQLSIDGDNLLCGPRNRITDQHRSLIRANKAEIIQALRSGLAECPLWKNQLVCHAHTEGRCTYLPDSCDIANGMRRYIEEYLRDAESDELEREGSHE